MDEGKSFVVTGGSGFFGSQLLAHLAGRGHRLLSIDCLPDDKESRPYAFRQLDIADRVSLREAIAGFGPVDGIFHVAAVLAHDKRNFHRLWRSNVDGTRNVMETASELGIRKVVFTSSNCVFATTYDTAVDESTPVSPIEEYGRTKVAGEEIVGGYAGSVQGVSIRCPTIVGAGRLGLLTILFDFVREGRRMYLVGGGHNRYSFIHAGDLAAACLAAMGSDNCGIYHVGSDGVPTLEQLYADLYHFAGKTPRFVHLPAGPTALAMKVVYDLGLSPLGPYHYRMLAANFVFDNGKLKRDLGWAPTKTNSQMLCEAYKYYVDHRQELLQGTTLSPHRRPAGAGIINLLRLIS